MSIEVNIDEIDSKESSLIVFNENKINPLYGFALDSSPNIFPISNEIIINSSPKKIFYNKYGVFIKESNTPIDELVETLSLHFSLECNVCEESFTNLRLLSIKNNFNFDTIKESYFVTLKICSSSEVFPNGVSLLNFGNFISNIFDISTKNCNDDYILNYYIIKNNKELYNIGAYSIDHGEIKLSLI